MGCTSFGAWADAPRAWVHPHSLAKSEQFAAFQCLGQILTQRFLHVVFHGREQELFCTGSEQMRCQLLAGKYHFQPHSQLQQMFLLFRVMEILWTIFSSSLGWSSRSKMPWETQWSPPEAHFRAVSPADQGESNHSVGLKICPTKTQQSVGWVPLENQAPSATRQLLKGSTVQQLSLEKLRILLKDELPSWVENPGVCRKVG